MDELEFENQLMKLIERQNLLQWENYALDKNNDLNKINHKILKLVDNINPDNIFLNKRKREIFKSLQKKLLVENDPVISKLRNKLDNQGNYNKGLNNGESDFKSKLAHRMREDVIKLIHLRNKKALQLGFSSYPDLIFNYEELNKKKVIDIIKDYLENNIEKANHLIRKHELTWQNWFNKLRNLDKIDNPEPSTYINCLLNKLNLELSYDDLHFKFDKDGISGMTFCISSPDDVRILLKPLKSPMTVRVLFHECGHAVNYSIIKDKGIYNLYTTFFDELVAILFENIGIELCINQFERNTAEEVKLLETIRCSISFLFEIKLWEEPDNAEKLFEEYQSILTIKPKQKEMWALDSFRFIDPVYIQNYVLGEIYAQNIIKKLKSLHNNDHKLWGEILKKQFIKNGMEISFLKKYYDFLR